MTVSLVARPAVLDGLARDFAVTAHSLSIALGPAGFDEGLPSFSLPFSFIWGIAVVATDGSDEYTARPPRLNGRD
jgi:hypothetical protein